MTRFIVEDREKLAEKQVRLCTIMRNIYLRIGANLAHANLIDSDRDIFFLEQDEIFNIIEKGKYTDDEIKDRIATRKAEYAENIQKPYYETIHFFGAIKPENMIVYKSE